MAKKEISVTCSKTTCEHYNKHQQPSKCDAYTDRRACMLSLSHRTKVAQQSKRRALNDNGAKNWMN